MFNYTRWLEAHRMNMVFASYRLKSIVDTLLKTLKKGNEYLIAYTDYPIHELGDKFYTKAPMRGCYVLSYDGEIYCEVIVEGMKEVIKSSKIYVTPSRSDPLTEDQLDLLVKE